MNQSIKQNKKSKMKFLVCIYFFFRKYLINFSCECQKTTSNQNKMRREREREMTRCLFHPKFYFFLRVCVCVYFDSIRLFISFSFHSFTVVELPGSFFIQFFFLMILHHHHQFTVYALHAWPCVCCCCLYLVRFFFFHFFFFFWLSK